MSQSDITCEEAKEWLEKNWSEWLPLDNTTVKTLPPLPGVYEVRLKDYSFPRLRGQTSTIYIGCTEARTLAKRLNGLLKGTHVARRRIDKIKNELKRRLEFRFRVAFAGKKIEQELLREYESQHLELPPCNHNVSRQ